MNAEVFLTFAQDERKEEMRPQPSLPGPYWSRVRRAALQVASEGQGHPSFRLELSEMQEGIVLHYI